MKHLKEVILQYVNSNSTNHQAIMITGGWGSGKTYFFKNAIKNIIEDKTKKKVLYISLNGVATLETVFQDLVSEKLWLKKYFSQNKTGKVTYGVIKSIFNIGINAFQLSTGWKALPMLNPKKGDIDKFDINELANFSQNVICFDDLERISRNLNIADVLGFINSNFVEHEGVKVIIICNEAEILSRDKLQNKKSADEGEYHLIKEKLISRTLEFDPDIGSTINTLINSFHYDSSFLGFLRTNAQFLKKKILSSKEKNLRSIFFMLDCLRIVLAGTERALVNQFAEQLILSVLLISFEEKRGTFKQFEFFLGILESLGPYSKNSFQSEEITIDFGQLVFSEGSEGEDQELDKKEKEVKALKERIRQDYIKEDHFILFPSILELVRQGYFDSIAHNKILRNLIPEKQPKHIQILAKFMKSYTLDDKDFIDTKTKVLKNIETGLYSLPEFIDAAKMLHDLSSNNLLDNYTKDSLNTFLLIHINRSKAKTSSEDLKEVRRAMTSQTTQFHQSAQLLAEIEGIQDNLKKEEKAYQMSKHLELLREEDYPNIGREEFRDIMIYYQLDSIKEVISFRYKSAPNKLQSIIDVFDHTYPTQNGFPNTVVRKEAEKLEQLLEWVKNLLDSIPVKVKPIAQFWVNGLYFRLKKIKESLQVEDQRITLL